MDLKDLTRGLRGEDDDARTDDESRAPTDRDSGTARDASADVASDRRESAADDDRAAGDAERDDAHVCPFCETEFDADRGACPECDAEIVLRGTR